MITRNLYHASFGMPSYPEMLMKRKIVIGAYVMCPVRKAHPLKYNPLADLSFCRGLQQKRMLIATSEAGMCFRISRCVGDSGDVHENT
jgi:hypothetical protein